MTDELSVRECQGCAAKWVHSVRPDERLDKGPDEKLLICTKV